MQNSNVMDLGAVNAVESKLLFKKHKIIPTFGLGIQYNHEKNWGIRALCFVDKTSRLKTLTDPSSVLRTLISKNHIGGNMALFINVY
jgi:hypothetical protein